MSPSLKWVVLTVMVGASCKGAAPRSAKGPTGAASSSGLTQAPTGPADLPPMPPYPEAVRGRLAVQSAGPPGTQQIARDWVAKAGVCETPPMMQIKGEQPGAGGTLVLLAVPENKITSYPVTLVAQGLPTPPAAQVGVQVYTKTGSFAYQAQEGSVDVYAFGKTVSGRFAVTLREINSNARLRYAGAFREVPVVQLDPAFCAPAAAGAKPRQ